MLDNAVKSAESSQIEIFARVDGDTLEWSIEDSGIGICHDDQNLIYDDFFQVDDSSTATYRGSGLGLPCSANWSASCRARFGSRARSDAVPRDGSASRPRSSSS